MTGINKKIDEHVRSNKRKFISTVVLSLIISSPILGWFLLPPLGAVSETSGIVVRLIGLPTDAGQSLYILVMLDSGEEVRSLISNSSYYKKGGRVNLFKHEPLLFGRKIYRYRGYINNGVK